MRAGTRRRTVAAAVAGLAAAAAAFAGEPSRDLRSPDAAVRLAAVAEIARTPSGELRAKASTIVPALRRALAKDASPEVRGRAAAALLRVAEDGAVRDVLDAMRAERDPVAERLLAESWSAWTGETARAALETAAVYRTDADLRFAALVAEALGLSGAASAPGCLALGPFPWPVEAGLCLGLRGVREVASVDALVARAGHPDPAVRSAAREALVFLVGEDRGTNPRDWERWWADAKATFRFPDGPPRAEAAGRAPGGRTSDRPRDAGAPTWAEFFGLPVRGGRVAFVVDYSQSMWGERRARAERELLEAVKGLPTTARVTVVFFNERVWTWRDVPVPARPQEKLDLAEHLPTLETKSYTNLFDAVETALAALDAPGGGVDEVFVLSDGQPNRGRFKDAERICAELRARNAGRARISCVALAEEGADLLRRLAAENGGGFVACPFPK